MEVNQVQTLLPGTTAAQLPLDVRAKLLAGQLAQQQSSAPKAPYNSRAAGLVSALTGGLGGLMEGQAIQQGMAQQQAHRNRIADALEAFPVGGAQAGGTNPTPAAAASAPSGQGGIGSDHAISPGDGSARDLAIRTIYGEAGGESPQGQAGVAAVLKNRLASGKYGSNMQGVITAPKQFSLWNPGDPAGDAARRLDPSSPAYQRIAQIYDGVMSGQIPDPTGGADHYYNPKAASPAWGPQLAQQNDVTIGNHRFVGRADIPAQPQSGTASADMPAPNAQPVASNTLPPGIVPSMIGGAPPSDGTVRGDLLAAAQQHGMPVSGAAPAPDTSISDTINAAAGPAVAGAPVVPDPQGDNDIAPPSPSVPASDPVAAVQMQGRDVAMDPVVPDPQGSLVPPAPSSPNGDLAGPQSDAAMGNGAPEPSLRDTIMASGGAGLLGSGAGASGPQSDAGMGNAAPTATAPAAPAPSAPVDLSAGLDGSDPTGPGLSGGLPVPSLGPSPASAAPAAAPAVPVDPAGAMSGFAPTEGASPGSDGPSLRDTLTAAMNGAPAAPPPDTSLPATAPLPPQGGQSADPGAPTDLSAKAAIAPGISGEPGGSPAGSSAPPLPMLAQAGAPPAPTASLQPGTGGNSAALSKLAVGPLTPSYMSGLAKALSGPQPGDGAAPGSPPGAQSAGPAPVAPQMLAQALQQPNGVPGHSALADPSSPQNFQRQQMLAQQLGGGAPTPVPPSPQALAGAVNGGSGPAAPAPQSGTPSASPAGLMALGSGQGGQPTRYPAGSPQAAYDALLRDPMTTPEEMQMLQQRMRPQMSIQKMDNGDLVAVNQYTGQLTTLAHGGKFAAAHNGVIYNEGTGFGPGQSADGSGAAPSSNFRPATPAERASYGVTDSRPMFIGPGGEPHFGEPQPAGQGETAEAKSAGEAAAARRNDMIAAANAAPEKIARLSLLGKVLDATQTGPLAGETGTAAAVANRLGIAPERLSALGIDPNQAVNTAVANKLAGEMTMGSIGAKNGGMPASNFSVAERQFIDGLYPNIENQPGANRAVTDVLTAMEQRKLQVADAWSTYKDQNAGKPLSYENFEDAFRRAHSQDNIFAPIIQKYQAGGYTPSVPGPNGASTPQPQGGPPPAPAAPPQPGVTAAPGGQPGGVPAGQTPPAAQAALTQAQAAIAKGAPRAAVIQRLQSMGINPAGL